MAGTQIETVAYILKEEHIASLQHHIRPNTFVVEAEEPYPGYHGLNVPNERKHEPGDIFLITKKRYAAEQIAHVTRKVRYKCDIPFDAARAELFFFNDTYSAIRLRGLKTYEQVEDVQKWYIDNNVAFAKRERTDTKAVIKIQKMLWADEVEEGIFQDLDDPNTKYFAIPKEITWQEFVDITLKIKRNTNRKDYDAAYGGIFRRNGLTDMVRIFSDKDSSLENLKGIRDLYLAEIKRLD